MFSSHFQIDNEYFHFNFFDQTIPLVEKDNVLSKVSYYFVMASGIGFALFLVIDGLSWVQARNESILDEKLLEEEDKGRRKKGNGKDKRNGSPGSGQKKKKRRDRFDDLPVVPLFDKSLLKTTIGELENRVYFKSEAQASATVHATDRTTAALLSSILPIDLSDRPWYERFITKLMQLHPVLALASSSFAFYFPETAMKFGCVNDSLISFRWLQIVGQCLNALFAGTLVATIFLADDGTCQGKISRDSCHMPVGLNQESKLCFWDDARQYCDFRDSNVDLKLGNLVVIIGVVSVLAVPLNKLLAYLVREISVHIRTDDIGSVSRETSYRGASQSKVYATSSHEDFDESKFDGEGQLARDESHNWKPVNGGASVGHFSFDELRSWQSDRCLLMQAARLVKMQKSIDFKTPSGEVELLAGVSSESQPVFIASSAFSTRESLGVQTQWHSESSPNKLGMDARTRASSRAHTHTHSSLPSRAEIGGGGGDGGDGGGGGSPSRTSVAPHIHPAIPPSGQTARRRRPPPGLVRNPRLAAEAAARAAEWERKYGWIRMKWVHLPRSVKRFLHLIELGILRFLNEGDPQNAAHLSDFVLKPSTAARGDLKQLLVAKVAHARANATRIYNHVCAQPRGGINTSARVMAYPYNALSVSKETHRMDVALLQAFFVHCAPRELQDTLQRVFDAHVAITFLDKTLAWRLMHGTFLLGYLTVLCYFTSVFAALIGSRATDFVVVGSVLAATFDLALLNPVCTFVAKLLFLDR